jgi:PAS domain S-box-containing protein
MTGLQEKKARSIQSLLIILLLSVLIPVLAIQSYIYYDSYQTQRASALQANLEIARAVAKSFESFVKDVLNQELAIGLAITSSQPMTPKDITRILESSRAYEAVRDFTWMNPRGDAIYSGNSAVIGRNYSERSYFRGITNGREWTVGELIISKATGKPVFGISRGIRDKKGTLLGVVVAMIIPENLDTRLAVERSEGGAFTIVDNKGMLIYRYPAIKATWEERNWLQQYPEFREALKGEEAAATVYAPFEGENRLVGFTPISSIRWAVGAGKREEDVIGPILSSIAKSAFVFLFVSLAAFLVALAVSRKITSPVTALLAHALALGRGEAPEQVKIEHVLEFHDLAEAFSTMAEKVQAREMDLRESEQRWATTLASIGDAVIATDVEGRITFMNTVAEELTGWTLSEASMKPVTVAFNIINEHTRKEVESPITKVLREGMIVGLANHTILIKKDGTEVPIDDSGAPIRDKEGNTLGVVLAFRDITERKRAEGLLKKAHDELEETVWKRTNLLTETNKALMDEIAERNRIAEKLEKSEEQYRLASAYNRSLIEVSLDPLVTIDAEGRISDVNTATETITGCPRNGLIGTDFADYFTDPKKAREGYRKVFSEGFVRDYPLAIRHTSGKVTEVLYNATIYKDDKGEVKGVFAAARDVTDLRRTQQALQQTLDQLELRIKERTAELVERTRQLEVANKDLESFSYSVSHDLRAPLRAIDGYARMLLKKHEHEFDEDSMRRFNVIRSSAQMMGQLIDDLLTFSRLGRKDVSKSKIDMEALISDVWKELQVISPDRKINLTVNSMPSGYGDRTLIKQVYTNLLSNAVKFTKFRDPALIEVGGHADGNDDVYYVKDNGVGFDMTYYDKLFGVFQRLHKADEFEGTGIGLATVHRMINRHGGRVWAEGKVDEGATFYFSLPSPQIH